MQFPQKNRAIVRLPLLLFHSTKLIEVNKREQNVSFDRSTPGLAGDFERFRALFGCYTMRQSIRKENHSQVK